MEKIVDVLEMYDGLSLAADEINTLPIFETCAKHFDSFIQLLDVYHSFPEFELYILQIFSHLAAHLSFEALNLDQKNVFYTRISKLLTVYSKNEVTRKRNSQANEEEGLFEDLSSILSLLANLLTGEFEGLEKAHILQQRTAVEPGHTGVAQVVFLGIECILPLITESMLQASNYFFQKIFF
jgi:hypothetical protein